MSYKCCVSCRQGATGKKTSALAFGRRYPYLTKAISALNRPTVENMKPSPTTSRSCVQIQPCFSLCKTTQQLAAKASCLIARQDFSVRGCRRGQHAVQFLFWQDARRATRRSAAFQPSGANGGLECSGLRPVWTVPNPKLTPGRGLDGAVSPPSPFSRRGSGGGVTSGQTPQRASAWSPPPSAPGR